MKGNCKKKNSIEIPQKFFENFSFVNSQIILNIFINSFEIIQRDILPHCKNKKKIELPHVIFTFTKEKKNS